MKIRLNPGLNIEINPEWKCGGADPLGDLVEKRTITGEADVHERVGRYLIAMGHAVEADKVDDEEETVDLDALSYRELQALAGERGLAATGTSDEIRERLRGE